MMAARSPGNSSRTSRREPRKQPPNTRAAVAANRVLDDGESLVPMDRTLRTEPSRAHALGKSNQSALESAHRPVGSDRRAGPGDPWRGRERPTSRGEQPAAALAEIIFAIAGCHLALGVLHQAAAGGAVREAQSMARLVDGDLGEALARVVRAGRPHATPKFGDDARRAAETPQ